MKALSIFYDEAGQQDMSAGYHLITMVSHGQNAPIDIHVEDCQRRLTAHQLPDIPFHMKELMHGHGDCEGVGLFDAFVGRLPIQYQTFFYSSYDTTGTTLSARMGRNIVNFAPTVSTGSIRSTRRRRITIREIQTFGFWRPDRGVLTP